MLSLALLAFFDMLVYRHPFLLSIRQLYSQVPYFAGKYWILLALAFLVAAWNDLERLPAIKRILAKKPGGRRKEQHWRRN
ncbi:hypothetical protein SAMN05216312_114149 [Cohnella sp. OV330]|uniref:hypothetical protein n=1 Tax=Cohnella sp. OV330 TaxID=1855288 RepID=UPI0008E11F6E|nr:hypothetical protein [Cohnella sp. OV330]SFB58013.1 hypothetical protein SAMN05216312_114149 [Cohnella sp. OV330]